MNATELTLRDIQAIEARARVLRAQAFAGLFRALGRGIADVVRFVLHPLPRRIV